MKNILYRAKRYLVSVYFMVRNFWPIWFYLLNRRGEGLAVDSGLFMGAKSKLNDNEKEIVATLANEGIAILDAASMFSDDFFVALKEKARKLEDYPEVTEESAMKGGYKTFLTKLWGGYGFTISQKDFETNPFVELALSDKVLRVITAYLGVCPKLYSFDLARTIKVSSQESAKFSQRWHRDPEDKKMMKVFIYFSDVDDKGAGPFMYVRGSQYGGRLSHVYPARPPAGVYPPEGAVEKVLQEGDVRICLGKTGTLIFCDTAGLHRGGYSTTRERLMLTITFASEASILKRYFTLSDDAKRSNLLSSLSRFALNIK